MARPLRLEFPGAVYHITARGNARQIIFLDDKDRKFFLSILERVVEQFGWICHAYTLMNNHYHLLIETPDANLSRGMRQLNGIYTQKFNWRHSRVGHLFQGRFKSILVEKGSYLLELSRYVVLNPVRAGIVLAPGEWLWSSYRATAGLEPVPAFLTVDWILAQFGRRKGEAQFQYRRFVSEGVKRDPFKDLRGGILLGGDEFIEKVATLLEEKVHLKEVPREQRFSNRPELSDLFSGIKSKTERDERIYEAHMRYGYTQSEIGKALGLHYSTVSKIIKMRFRLPKKSNSKVKT